MKTIYEERVNEKLVRIRYTQRRDEKLGCTMREVNIIFSDDSDDDGGGDTDGNQSGKKIRKKTTIRISKEPSDKENCMPHN